MSSSSSAPKKRKVAVCAGGVDARRLSPSAVAFAREHLPTLIVSGRDDVVGERATLLARLASWNVTTIVNLLSLDEVPGISANVLTAYKEGRIRHITVRLREDATVAPKNAFFAAIGEAYMEHYKASPTGAMLVHCQRGCNRSGIAIAALLWMTSPAGTWPSVHAIVECMRESSDNFIRHEVYESALERWAGDGQAPSRPREAFGEGRQMRAMILNLQQSTQHDGLTRALAALDSL
jgi:hypothetical protein